MTRCDWCVGFVRRDCTIMKRCVQTGVRRPHRDVRGFTVWKHEPDEFDLQAEEDALAAGSRRAETNEDLAQCEASQSGPNGATPK